MLDSIWGFLKDESNQALLGWIGSGIVVIAGAVWAVFKFFANKAEKGSPPPSVKADRGGVAIGRDNINSPINVDKGGTTKR
jgi:hypothetical protein